MNRVLIIDDSPTETELLRQILSHAGYQVLSAGDGETGCAMARSQHPDVILMDVVMPGLNGFQATRELGQDPDTRDIPVIVVSKKNQASDQHWARRQGARDYLVKPIDRRQLLDKIAGVLA